MREFPASSSDRRQAPRTKLVDIAYIGMGPENGGLVLDVSDGGLSFHSVAPVQPSEKINFLLSLRGHSRIEGSGEVVWTNEMRTVCGMRFTSLSSGAREHLSNWTSQAKSSPGTRQSFSIPAPPQETPRAPENPPTMPVAEPMFVAEPDYIAPLTLAEEKPLWQKPFVLWIAFALLACGLVAVAFDYGLKVGRSQAGVASPPAPNATASSSDSVAASPAAPTAPVAPETSSPSNEVSAAPGVVAPAPAGSLVNASKTDDGAGPNGQSQDADGNPALSREQRAEQALEAGQSQLAAAQASLRGDGGPRDSVKAAHLLWAAVGNGNSEAEVILADLYLLGDGVPKSCEQGRVLLTAASKTGNSEALEKLNELDANGCR